MRYWFYIISFLISTALVAQEKDSLKTSLPKTDSLNKAKANKFYQNIHEKSNQSKLTNLLHDFIFQPVNPSNKNQTTKTLEKDLNRNFKEFQGKIIRKIYIKSLDPIGYNEKDTTQIPKRKIDKIGNALHSRSKSFTVKGLILLKPNQPVDSLLILESERLLRRRNFIRRALIKPQNVEGTNMVDVYVYVLDSWSLVFDGDLASDKGALRVRELNFMGLGHQLTLGFKKGFGTENGTGYTLGYRAPNLYNTYINAEASRDVEVDQTYKNVFQVDRNFYSPFTRWAGKIGFTQRYDREDIYLSNNDTTVFEPVKRFEIDVWGGYAIPILKKYQKEEQLPTNLIIAARYAKRQFSEKPDATIDSVSFFANQNFFLGSIGVRHVKYVRDRYVFRNGDIEDIAIGGSYFLYSGYQQNTISGNYYFGASVTLNNYFSDFGYIAGSIEYGSYYSNGDPRQSLFKLQTTYFTPVFSIGKWYFRQFAKLNSVVGIERKNIILDRIDLNGENGIWGFNSPQVYGTRKFVFSLKTQSYVPFNWLGFRMSPFADFDLGCIGHEPKPFFKNTCYTKFGIGFLISNDYFVFENIKLSFFYIPKMPGNNNTLQFRGSNYNTFNLQNYNYQPPHILEYN